MAFGRYVCSKRFLEKLARANENNDEMQDESMLCSERRRENGSIRVDCRLNAPFSRSAGATMSLLDLVFARRDFAERCSREKTFSSLLNASRHLISLCDTIAELVTSCERVTHHISNYL